MLWKTDVQNMTPMLSHYLVSQAFYFQTYQNLHNAIVKVWKTVEYSHYYELAKKPAAK